MKKIIQNGKVVNFKAFYYILYFSTTTLLYLIDSFINWSFKNPIERYLNLPFENSEYRANFLSVTALYTLFIWAFAKAIKDHYEDTYKTKNKANENTQNPPPQAL